MPALRFAAANAPASVAIRAARRAPRTLKDRFELLARLAREASAEQRLRPMFERIAALLQQELAFPLVVLAGIEDDHWRIEALHSLAATPLVVDQTVPLKSGGRIARAAASGTTQRWSGISALADSIRAELAVPVLYAGRVIAVLLLGSELADDPCPETGLLENIALQLAGTIAAAQRLQQLDRRAVLLETVATVIRQALEAPDLGSLCDRLLEALGERMQLAEATILLESDLKDHLQVVAHRGASPHVTWPGKLWPVSAGVVGRCFRERSAQWVPQIADDLDYAHVNSRVQAEYAVPICYRERVFGVLNLETEQARLLGELERLAAHALADQAGGALHLRLTNQRLSETLKRMQTQDQQLEHTRESLQRAVGKLKRRGRAESATGLPDRQMLLGWLQRECVALRRGGRGAALLLVHWPSAGVPPGAIAALERTAPGLRGRLAALAPNRLAALLGAAHSSAALVEGLPELWQLLHAQWHAVAAGLTRVDAPARLSPEAWLERAEMNVAAPPLVRWAAATAG